MVITNGGWTIPFNEKNLVRALNEETEALDILKKEPKLFLSKFGLRITDEQQDQIKAQIFKLEESFLVKMKDFHRG